MKTSFMKCLILLFTFTSLFLINVFPQENAAAYQYLNTISENSLNISKKYMSYASAVAHSKRARKVENKRQDLLKATSDARKKAMAMPCFENDCALHDSLVSFLSISYYVINSDYEKIVNMEEVAEQSYDLMEAYMNARELANLKVEVASVVLGEKYDGFAQKHKIPLADNKSKLSKDIEKANRVNDHYNRVFLIFFKSYKQEAYLIDAIARKDYSGAEQNRNALLQVATEGISKLDTMKGYNNDKALIMACKRVLEFHKTEAKDKIGLILDYMLKQENYDKLDKLIGSKEPMLRTQQEIDQFNKAITDVKAAMTKYNPTNNYLNQNRTSTTNGWNTISQNYLERYIPKYD